ncbi:uncharacterized protein K02A2.6-like [Micropterus dolomieu]|uniref:uncharacterized protein K02A2.6-like n=1 Tax=Micropterus dolomieu TaxID=147949 RepID=UPI001E8E1917|nr:uncharacterized protein K02A2.6-like [Micropterus dolomieu]
MKELAEALLLLSEVAIVRCKGHDTTNTPVAKGNQAADQASKQVVGYSPSLQMISTEEEVQQHTSLTEEHVKQCQQKASPQEKTVWKQRGATETGGLWRGPDGRLVLPPTIRQKVLEEAHGVGHVGPVQMSRHLCHWWHPYLTDMTKEFVRGCQVSMVYNPRPTVKPEMGTFLMITRPGHEISINYTDMVDRGYRYVLMCIDTFTGWPEAWPTKKEDSKSVIKCLINHYIPRHGFPEKIRSDNGTHFKHTHLQQVETMLGLKPAFGTVYHPQSQGKVERMNQNIKGKLAKICAQTKLNWVDALPLALMSVRSSVNQRTGFTPYELLTGRHFPGPGAGLKMQEGFENKVSHRAYFNELQALVSGFSNQGGERSTHGKQYTVPQADWVLLKVIKRKWSEPRWTGPFQVVERTSHLTQREEC